jgi:NADH:ubiquinone oxidoreductase subunit 6 (subunit J)
MAEQILFVFVSVFTISAALIVVTNRNLFHAALALMASFLGVAGLYVLLEAGFLAAAQLSVYIGAISILVIFAIMMTRRLMQAVETPFNSQHGLGLVTAVVTLGVFAFVIGGYWPLAPDEAVPLAARTPVGDAILRDSVEAIGRALVSADAYVIPFEVASVLLLGALIGAILIAWPPTEDNS